MNNNIELIKDLYKPFKYTFKGNSKIIETSSGIYAVKESKSNLNELFSYLSSRNFNSFPKIMDESRNNIYVYEYIDDIKYPREQKANDLITLVANLHNKTSYYKDVTEDKYKEIYENILSNINYLSEKYNNYYDEFYKDLYLSPSKYLFMCNYSKIMSNLNFCREELDNWYELVKDNKKTKISIVHNNLSLDHYLKNDKEYLISWDKYLIDTPIIDLVNFYKKEYFDLNFEELLKNYNKHFNLSNDEKKLFLILISIPPTIEFNNNEFTSTVNISSILDYIYKTEYLIRPYYFKNQEEKDSNFN